MILQHPPLLRVTDSEILESCWKLKKGDLTGRAFAESTVRAVAKRLGNTE